MGQLKACHLDRQRLEVVRVRRSVRQQQRQQQNRAAAAEQRGFRPVKSAQDALREAWIATWVRRMCREAMGEITTSPAAE
jgi:hypothetical protein